MLAITILVTGNKPPKPNTAPSLAALAVKLAIGVALLVTALPAARDGTGALDGAAADGARIAATAFFLVAMCALIELHGSRPDVGCGCFGDLSTTPVSARSIVRSGVLAVAALASIGGPGLQLARPGAGAALPLTMFCPEAAEILVRLGYSEPCELRSIPARRTIAALHRSSHWPRHAGVITSETPADMWRELCWRYVVYPGRVNGTDADVVFAVQMKQRRPVIRSAVVPRETAAPPGKATSAGLPPGVVPLSAMPISNAL